MKVAVLVVGELRDNELVKNLYDGCDVFIHTDKKYGKPFSANYQYFNSHQQIFVNKVLENDKKSHNYHRVIQWLRYQELLKNDLSNYDVVVKIRTDLDLSIDNLYEFLKDKTIEDNTLYAMKDFIWYGRLGTMIKTDFYNDIIFYINRDEIYFPINYDSVLNSDLDAMEFTWLNWDKNIDYDGDIKKQIIDNRDNLETINLVKSVGHHSKIKYYNSFKSEKFFLHYLLDSGIYIKKLGFNLKFRNRFYHG